MTVLRNAHAAGDTAAAQRAAQRVRELQAPVAQRTGPDPFAGDDLLSDQAMSKLAAGEDSTVTSSSQPSGYLSEVSAAARKANTADGSAPVGTLEALGALVSGAIATPIASVAGIGAEAARGAGLTDAKGEDTAARVQNALTYQPRGQSGKAQLGLVSAVTQPIADSGADVALLPLAAEAPLWRATQRQRFDAGLREKMRERIPSTEELTDAARRAYQSSKDAGIVAEPEAYTTTLGKVRSMVMEEGIDPTLHPKSSAVMKRLEEANGKPLTLQEAETLRKIALDAEDDLNPVTREPTPDARMAGKIVDELDDSLDALSANAPARAMYARSRRSQLLDRMIHRAKIKAEANYTQAGEEHALRQEFKNLAINPRRMRGFTPEQRAAIEKVAMGGRLENAMRNLGKMDPTKGGMAAFTGSTLGLLSGGPFGLAVPAAGFLGKRAATRMTMKNVDRAREALVGREAAEVPPVEKPASAPAAMEGELMPRAPLALPAPNIVAGSRSAPGTAYAREQMGLTPDVEQAGALHPGAAREMIPSDRAPALDQRAPIPSYPPALPYRAAPAAITDQRPMIIDAQGRVAPNAEKLREYLQATGQDRMQNVRQPSAEPVSRPFGLVDAPQSPAVTNPGKRRSAAQILKDMQRVDDKAKRLPKNEPLDSPRVQALAADWARFRDELARVESRASARKASD